MATGVATASPAQSRRARRAVAALAAAACFTTALAACSAETASDGGAPSTSGTSISNEDRAKSTGVPTTPTTPTTASVPEVPGQVLIRDYELLPPTVTVAAGGTVTWQNADDVDHWMLTDDGTTVDSGTITGGQSYVTTLSTPGTYAYYCDIHNSMTGTIVVE
jgi:plastocyanin